MTTLVIALVIVVPLVLLPAALVWFLNITGILTTIQETRKRRIARERRMAAEVRAK
jgi:hypothetical protein